MTSSRGTRAQHTLRRGQGRDAEEEKHEQEQPAAGRRLCRLVHKAHVPGDRLPRRHPAERITGTDLTPGCSCPTMHVDLIFCRLGASTAVPVLAVKFVEMSLPAAVRPLQNTLSLRSRSATARSNGSAHARSMNTDPRSRTADRDQSLGHVRQDVATGDLQNLAGGQPRADTEGHEHIRGLLRKPVDNRSHARPVRPRSARDSNLSGRTTDTPPPLEQPHKLLTLSRQRTTPRPLLHTTRRQHGLHDHGTQVLRQLLETTPSLLAYFFTVADIVAIANHHLILRRHQRS
jgi:hypothetical protein